MVLYECHSFKRGGLIFPAFYRLTPAFRKRFVARLKVSFMSGVHLGQAFGKHGRNQKNIAWVPLNMMVSLGVDVTIGTVQALGNVEFFDVISRFKVAWLPGLDLVVSGLAQQNRQPSGLDPQTSAYHQIRVARFRD